MNTLYAGSDGTIDFLADVDLVRGWLRAIQPSFLACADRVDEADRRMWVDLRSAIRNLFGPAEVTEVALAVAVLEGSINASRPRWELAVDDQHGLVSDLGHDLENPAGVAAAFAHAAITIATDSLQGRVSVCARPACDMRYLQHHRRRYCSAACTNAGRESRFQQRDKN